MKNRSWYFLGLLFTTIILLTSCSAKWHLRKAVKKDPSILIKPQIVTVDTVIITEAVHATDTFMLREHDTIVNTVNGIEYKIIRQVDTFSVDIKCPPDTVRVFVQKECPPSVVYQPLSWFERNKWWMFILVIVGVAAYLIHRFRNL